MNSLIIVYAFSKCEKIRVVMVHGAIPMVHVEIVLFLGSDLKRDFTDSIS